MGERRAADFVPASLIETGLVAKGTESVSLHQNDGEGRGCGGCSC